MKVVRYAVAATALAIVLSAFSIAVSSCGPSSAPVTKTLSSEEAAPAKPLKETKKKEVTSLTPNPDRVLYIEGPIGPESAATAAKILRMGHQSKEPIYLLINSPGGSVLDGTMIISAIEGSEAPVKTVCTQLCASMAAIIFEYGQERLSVDRSILMFHPASGGAEGEIDKMVSRLSTVQRYIGKLEAHIAARVGITFERYKELSGVEYWIDGEDAVNNSFSDKLVSLTLPERAESLMFLAPPSQQYVPTTTHNTYFLDWTFHGLTQVLSK